jgi:hypothetical protein
MAVPYTFGSATASIPLSQLDSNFATTITLGNTAIQLGNTVTTLNNMTLANVTISSGTSNLAATAITNGTSNVTIASSGGAIAMATNGATAITVDTSQNVGIGTASPTAKLTVNNATATDYVTLTTAGSTKGVLADEAGDLIIKSASSLLFQTNGAIRARLNTTGAFVLAGGTTTANGIGITFPATQSASSDANTLDDYEEGTWTPSVSGTATYSGQTGTYTKIGNAVRLYFDMSILLIGTGSATTISGLPFSANANDAGSISYFLSGATNVTWISLQVSNGTSMIVVGTTAAQGNISNGINIFGNGTRLIGTVVYKSAT